MDRLNASLAPAPSRPVRVLQYGEGNFLRAFVDYFIDIANEKTDFNGSVVLVKPIAFGNLDRFHQQDCRYTVVLRGLEDGQRVEKDGCAASRVAQLSAVSFAQSHWSASCGWCRRILAQSLPSNRDKSHLSANWGCRASRHPMEWGCILSQHSYLSANSGLSERSADQL